MFKNHRTSFFSIGAFLLCVACDGESILIKNSTAPLKASDNGSSSAEKHSESGSATESETYAETQTDYNLVSAVLPTPRPTPVSPNIEARAAFMVGTYKGQSIVDTKFGWADILAQLKLNPNDPVSIQRFVNHFIGGKWNKMFMHVGAGWIVNKYWDKFTPAQRDLLLKELKTGVTGGHGTENHFLMKYIGAHLYAQAWPNETGWYDVSKLDWHNVSKNRRITSAELKAATKRILLKTLNSYYSKGYHENLSPNYLSVHLAPLHALYTSVTDPELKAAANAAITFHVANMAANFFEGATISPFNRHYPKSDDQKNTTLNTHLKAVYWLYWAELMNTQSTTSASFPSQGSQSQGGEAKHFALLSALSDWRPPALFASLAQGAGILPFSLKSAEASHGDWATGLPACTLRTVYRDKRFAVGSGNYVTRFGTVAYPRGLSERNGHEIVYKSKDYQNTITVTHPYWRTNVDQGIYSKDASSYQWLSRSSPFQQNVQHKATVISLFNIPQADPFVGRTRSDWEKFRNEYSNNLIQQAWIRYPKSIDEAVQSGGWIFLRESETYMAIRPWGATEVNASEYPGMNVVQSSGAKNAVIIDIATVEQFATFAAFRSAVLKAPLTVNLNAFAGPIVSYRNVRGDTIVAEFQTSAYQASTVFDFYSIPKATVNGVAQVMRDADFVDQRAVIKSGPLSLINRVLTVDIPAGRLTVDWRGDVPVFSTK